MVNTTNLPFHPVRPLNGFGSLRGAMPKRRTATTHNRAGVLIICVCKYVYIYGKHCNGTKGIYYTIGAALRKTMYYTTPTKSNNNNNNATVSGCCWARISPNKPQAKRATAANTLPPSSPQTHDRHLYLGWDAHAMCTLSETTERARRTSMHKTAYAWHTWHIRLFVDCTLCAHVTNHNYTYYILHRTVINFHSGHRHSRTKFLSTCRASIVSSTICWRHYKKNMSFGVWQSSTMMAYRCDLSHGQLQPLCHANKINH